MALPILFLYIAMEGDHHLPGKFICYKRPFERLWKARRLFSTLLLDYRACLKCIFRIFSIDHPRLYCDPQFYLELLPRLLGQEEWESTLKLGGFDLPQCCAVQKCWLCEEIFQHSSLRRLSAEVQAQTKQKGFQHFQQFKLNVRIPNVLLLRSLILQRYIYWRTAEHLSEEERGLYYELLVHPLESHQLVQPKSVLKWLLASEVGSLTSMRPTADDHPDNLTVSIELDYQNQEAESNVVSQLTGLLGLEKKDKVKRRKQRVEVVPEQSYKCNSFNIGKIAKIGQKDFEHLFAPLQGEHQFWKFVSGREGPPFACEGSQVSHTLALLTKNVYLCGRYIKFSRYLSQTPWVVNGQKLTEGSLQEQIEDRIFPLFFPGRPKADLEIKFHAGGREDIDVRMLKGGRPFVLEFENPIRSISTITEEEVLGLAGEESRAEIKGEFERWGQEQGLLGKEEFHSWRITKLLELLINHQNQFVQISGFMETTESYISVELKAAEMDKIKHYLCYIHSPSQLAEEDKARLEGQKDLALMQLTPLRVLHRRTLMVREKLIHALQLHLVSRHSAVLEVWASAGTYIKEFVHGDLGRTSPSVGSLLGKEVDILQLDVGSLKEGEWAKGDEKLMQMDKFAWVQ